MKSKKLSEFLVWDLIKMQREQGSVDFETMVKKIFEKISQANKKYFFVKWFDFFYNLLHNFSKKRIYFKGDRFKQFISETKKQYPVGLVVSGAKDRLYAIKNFLPYFSVSHLYEDVDKYFKTGNEKYLRKLVKGTNKLLKDKAILQLVLWNDCFPIDRSIILSSRKLKIPTTQIQIGMYNSEFAPDNGREADSVFVWGDYFKEMYSKFNVRSTKNIHILGYPKKIKHYPSAKKIKKVVYLGQNIEKFNSAHLKTKIDTVRDLNKICKSLGLSFEYRPHPNDKLQFPCRELPEVNFSQGSLIDSFDDADVFISFFSTALIEAVMANKLGMQLRNYDMKTGNFEKLGICKSFSKLNQVKSYLEKLKKDPKKGHVFEFSQDYIYHPKSAKKRFIQLLKKIIKNEIKK